MFTSKAIATYFCIASGAAIFASDLCVTPLAAFGIFVAMTATGSAVAAGRHHWRQHDTTRQNATIGGELHT